MLIISALLGAICTSSAFRASGEHAIASNGGSAPGAKEDPSNIETNMFKLVYERIHRIDRKKMGGGLAATPNELVILTGGGKIFVMNLSNDGLSDPEWQLPRNNEESAAQAAATLVPADRAGLAQKNVQSYLRYDDVLVFDDADSRYVAISYSHFDPKHACFAMRVALLKATAGSALAELSVAADDWDLIFESRPCFPFKEKRHPFAGHQSGGRLALLDSEAGTILLALGDYEFDGLLVPAYPQRQDVDYGKVHEIDVRTGASKVLSTGHRNPQGILVDARRNVWTVEHGPQGGDELNLLRVGADFGWPKVTLGVNYGTKPWPFNPRQGAHADFEHPIYAWVPSIAPSNLDEVVGFHPFWDSDLLVFTLKTESIWRLRVHQDRVILAEEIRFGERIRYGLNHPASRSLFLWTDPGNLYRVKPGPEAWTLLDKSKKAYEWGLSLLEGTGAPPAFVDLEPPLVRACVECHSGGENGPPNLKGVLGRKIAGTSYKGYSAALSGKGGAWTADRLCEFLMHPQEFAAGNSMPDPQVETMEECSAIVEALRDL